MEIFGGELSPEIFVNQDADPYLWDIYRRFGASRFAKTVQVTNEFGGDSEPRYKAVHVDWKHEVLQDGVDGISEYLQKRDLVIARKLTIDVITPSYRVHEDYLRAICELRVPDHCSTQFIIIVDDPLKGDIRDKLEDSYGDRVRVRVNNVNRGASFSRNRGLDESSADWVLFLDDDVQPGADIILRYAERIEVAGDECSGLVGLTTFPEPHTIFAFGVKLSFLTYFWAVAEVTDTPPWGVTANLVTRRSKERFSLLFPKTGGGEDIDYCLRTAEAFGLPLLSAPRAHAVHPYWSEPCDGAPSPLHFFGWANGDSILMDLYPEHRFLSWPNVWELTVVVGLYLSICGPLPALSTTLTALWMCEFSLDIYQGVHQPGLAIMNLGQRFAASALASVYKNSVELGHLICPFMRGSWCHMFHRWDWWCGLHPDSAYRGEKRTLECRRFAWLCVSYFAVSQFPEIVPGLVHILAGVLFCIVTYSSMVYSTLHHLVSTGGPAPISGIVSVVFICDDNYAMALGVALQSLLDHTENANLLHVTIIDNGISPSEWGRVQQICSDIALERVEVNEKMETTWLKKDIPALLQNHTRVLYLDCDILVRKPLTNLWTIDMGAFPVAAARDVGEPCGMRQLQQFGWPEGAEYFNAGVMLLDLTQIRTQRLDRCLADNFVQHIDTGLHFKEQDIFNLVFQGNWQSLSLEWNAQGLGTYSIFRTRPEPEHGRPALFTECELADLQVECSVVHFTGAETLSMVEALSKHVRFASKPWCLTCCHPLKGEWFRVLRKTPWSNWQFLPQVAANACICSITDFAQLLEYNPLELLKEVKRKIEEEGGN